MAEQNFTDSFKNTMDNIRNMVDADTIIGEPITTPAGVIAIPVSKVTVGVVTGGMDYIGKHSKKDSEKANSFSGCGTSGVSITPVAFLIIKPEGDVELISVNNPQNQQNDLGTNIVSLLNKAPTIIEKIRSLSKKDKNKDEETDDCEELDLSDIVSDDK